MRELLKPPCRLLPCAVLALPCSQFIERMRESRGEASPVAASAAASVTAAASAAGSATPSPRGVVQCSPSTTFRELLSLLCDARVHRVFVVEETNSAGGGGSGRVVGVVTLTDVIRVVVSPESALVGAAWS